MSIKLLFFAQCAEWVQKKELRIPLNHSNNLFEILGSVAEVKPIVDRAAYLKVAVNQELKDFQTEVFDGDEVAFMPPYSGG